jgi:hypothetical protein
MNKELRGLVESFARGYREHEEDFIQYLQLFILISVLVAGYTHNTDSNDFFNIICSLFTSGGVILSAHFIKELYKKDSWLILLVVPPLAFYAWVAGFAFTKWDVEVVKALTGVVATFLGFFGVFVGYLLTTYYDRRNKLDEQLAKTKTVAQSSDILDKIKKLRVEKKNALRCILATFMCIFSSLLCLFIIINYLELHIQGSHPYRMLFIAASLLFYGVILALYLILQVSGHWDKETGSNKEDSTDSQFTYEGDIVKNSIAYD